MLCRIEASEHLFMLSPPEQQRLCTFDQVYPVNPGDLDSQFVWISWIATVREVPDVALRDEPLITANQ